MIFLLSISKIIPSLKDYNKQYRSYDYVTKNLQMWYYSQI